MKLVRMFEEIQKVNPDARSDERRVIHDRILEDLRCPLELSTFIKVVYDAKSDRYVAHFNLGNTKTAALKCTDEVAAFLIRHALAHGAWRGRMRDGELTWVVLVQPL